MDIYLLHIAYFLMLVAFLVREPFRLRSLMVGAQVSFISYGLVTDNRSMVVWSILFTIINSVQITRIILEQRPITLSPSLERVYRMAFQSLRRRDFLYFWRLGRSGTIVDTCLTKCGDTSGDVYFIVNGEVLLEKDGETITSLHPGSFIAETNLLENEPLVVDFRAQGRVRYMQWETETLTDMRKISPALYIRVMKILNTYVMSQWKGALSAHK